MEREKVTAMRELEQFSKKNGCRCSDRHYEVIQRFVCAVIDILGALWGVDRLHKGHAYTEGLVDILFVCLLLTGSRCTHEGYKTGERIPQLELESIMMIPSVHN